MYQHKDGITLRKANRHDLGKICDLKNESWWGTHRALIFNYDDQVKWLESLKDNELVMVATVEAPAKKSNIDKKSKLDTIQWMQRGCDFVGIAVYTDIDPINRSVNVSGSIAKHQRIPEIVKAAFGAGVDFAFEMLNVERIQAEVLSYHKAAVDLELDYLGFVVEGIRRKAIYKAGIYYDSLVLGMLREDWEKNRRVIAYGPSCCQFDHDTAMINMCQVHEKIKKS